MTERRQYPRSRKIVDYSKFSSQDSDDDDFSESRPLKKNKLSTKKNKDCSEVESRTNSSIVMKTMFIDNQNGHCIPIVTSSPVMSLGDKENESDLQQTGSATNTSVKKIDSECDIKTNRLSKKSAKLNADSGSQSSGKSNSAKTASQNVNDTDKVDSEGSETNDTLSYSPLSSGSSKHECSGSPTVKTLSTDKKETCLESPASLSGQTQLKSRWKPPGPASADALKNPNNTSHESGAKSNARLRIGLSRNIRVKPLHSNVKVQH